MYQYILLDLDGTLIDSEEGITKSASYALKKFGITEEPGNLRHFIGPPLFQSFSVFYGFSEEESAKAVKYYREYFGETGVHLNRVYDGIGALLQKLHDAGKTLILATSKYEYYARQIMDELDFSKYFSFIAGSLKDGGRGTKAEVISYILEQMGITDLSSAVMIGDRKHDIEGAKTVGMDSIGVLYGFGDYEELSSHGATYIAGDAEEIFKIIMD
ncbi:MAG: HAD hydrolase-like protein [Clostridia bacterium]|nr:HAD hydrolase-like protein [Clostridia bacterium]